MGTVDVRKLFKIGKLDTTMNFSILKLYIFGAKYSRMDQVKFVEDSL